MKRLSLLVGVLLLAGCHKKDKHGDPVITMNPVASCSYVVGNYSGVTTASPQMIAIQADPANFTNDLVVVYLCKIADCAAGIPSTQCAGAGTGTPCFTKVQFPDSTANVTIQKHLVALTNAQAAGYGSYAILEDACL